MRIETEMEKAAIHEAGHAVVALHAHRKGIGPRVTHATLKGPRLAAGEVSFAGGGNAETPRELLASNVRTLAAGLLAERLASGNAAGHERDAEKMLQLAQLEGWIAPSDPSNPGGTVSARTKAAVRMLRREFAVAELELRADWGAVEAVAAWLLQFGSVRGEHLGDVVDCAPTKRLLPSFERTLELLSAADGDASVGAAVRAVAAKAGVRPARPKTPVRRQTQRPRTWHRSLGGDRQKLEGHRAGKDAATTPRRLR